MFATRTIRVCHRALVPTGEGTGLHTRGRVCQSRRGGSAHVSFFNSERKRRLSGRPTGGMYRAGTPNLPRRHFLQASSGSK